MIGIKKLNESAKRREKENHSNDRNSSNTESDVESDEKLHYCSELDEHKFHMIKGEDKKEISKKNPSIAELLISISVRVEINKT